MLFMYACIRSNPMENNQHVRTYHSGHIMMHAIFYAAIRQLAEVNPFQPPRSHNTAVNYNTLFAFIYA